MSDPLKNQNTINEEPPVEDLNSSYIEEDEFGYEIPDNAYRTTINEIRTDPFTGRPVGEVPNLFNFNQPQEQPQEEEQVPVEVDYRKEMPENGGGLAEHVVKLTTERANVLGVTDRGKKLIFRNTRGGQIDALKEQAAEIQAKLQNAEGEEAEQLIAKAYMVHSTAFLDKTQPDGWVKDNLGTRSGQNKTGAALCRFFVVLRYFIQYGGKGCSSGPSGTCTSVRFSSYSCLCHRMISLMR